MGLLRRIFTLGECNECIVKQAELEYTRYFAEMHKSHNHNLQQEIKYYINNKDHKDMKCMGHTIERKECYICEQLQDKSTCTIDS